MVGARSQNDDFEAARIAIDSRDKFDAGLLARPPKPLVDGGKGDAVPRRKREVCGIVGGQIKLAREIGHLAKRGTQGDALDLDGK